MELFVRIWENYPIAIDLVLYFFLFAAASRAAFAKSFPSYEGRILSIAVGLFLAAGLAIAQRKLGFSTESMGPVAIFFIALIVFIMGYKLLRQADLPRHLTILFCGLFVVVLLRVTMPAATARFVRENPLTIFLVAAGVLAWVGYTTNLQVNRMEQRKPGHALERFKSVPLEHTLNKEKRLIKREVREPSRQDKRDEENVVSDLRHAQNLVEKEGINKKNRGRIIEYIDRSVKRSQAIRDRLGRLLRTDEALRRFDTAWFARMHGLNLNQLAPEQQKLVQDFLTKERKRVHVEEELERLQTEVDAHARALAEHLQRAREAAISWNAAALQGWINEATNETEKAHELDQRILQWEQRLLTLVKKQRHELMNAE